MHRHAALCLMTTLLLNQSGTSERAFAAPRALAERLGLAMLDAQTLAGLDREALARAMAEKPALHRFPRAMAGYLHAAMCLLKERYGGDPRLIWQGQEEEAVASRLCEFAGIGYHKTAQCLLLLRAMGEMGGLSPAYEAHMRRTCAHFLQSLPAEAARILAVPEKGWPLAGDGSEGPA